MIRHEILWAELAERDWLLREQTTATQQAETLLQVTDALQDSGDLIQGIELGLEICRRAVKADMAVLLHQVGPHEYETFASSEPGLEGRDWSLGDDFARRTVCITDTKETDLVCRTPPPAATCRSIISVPLGEHFVPARVLVLLSHQRARFARVDQRFVGRVATIVARAILNRQLQDRNAFLQAIVDGGAWLPHIAATGDTGFAALGRAFERLAEWQNRIVHLTTELLGAPGETLDMAIDRVLAEVGQLSGSDRTYVFRLRDPDRLDNTHEWVAPGIIPMRDRLQDLPVEVMGDWRPDLEAGRSVQVPDVDALPDDSATREILREQGIRSLLVVPMQRDGVLTGFIGHDAVRSRRHFLPTEIRLLESVAAAVGAVIDRSQAEIAACHARLVLAEERDRLRATLAALPELVLELDQLGRFTDYNSGGGTLLAFRPDEFLGRTLEEVLPPYLADYARALMRKADESGHSHGHEYPMVIDGVTRWFTVSAGARRKTCMSGGYVFIIHEVTDRRRQHQEIRRLSRIAELTSNMVVVSDSQGRIEWVNPAFEARTGWHLDEVRGRKPGHFLQFEGTDPGTAARVSAALKRGEAVHAEILNRCRDGTEYWISKDIQPLVDLEGQLEGFVAVQTDITALKASHQHEVQLRAAAIEASIDGIAISGPDGRYIDMNPAHRRMFGIPDDADIAALGWTDLMTAEGAAEFLRLHWPLLEAERRWRGEITTRRRDGVAMDLDVTLTLTGKNELVCIARDVTERRRMEEERARLRDELQQAHRRETVAHVAAGVAHDLNNLVAVVLGTVSLLQGNGSLSDDLDTGLRRITRAMGSARDLVDGLGQLGRPDRPREPLDLRKLVVEALDLLGSERTRSHSVHAQLPAAARMVWANRTELLQVIVNLALNACEAGEKGVNRVTLAVADEDGAAPGLPPDVGRFDAGIPHVILRITDTGAGVDPALRLRLFERYMTTKGKSGTGLGLPIVAGILRDNDGALWLESVPGQGTTVTVAWPAGTERSAGLLRPSPDDADDANNLNRHRILVVDDNIDLAEVLCRMIEADGAIAIAVGDPFEARDLLRENPRLWSALVTDFDMPGLNGAQLASFAAQSDPPVPSVLVTALPEGSGWDRSQFRAVHAKPVAPEALTRSLRAILGGRWWMA